MVKLKILILEVLLHLNEILQKSIFVCGEMKITAIFPRDWQSWKH